MDSVSYIRKVTIGRFKLEHALIVAGVFGRDHFGLKFYAFWTEEVATRLVKAAHQLGQVLAIAGI